MIKKRFQNKGQVTTTGYIVMFFLVIGALVTMAVYVQRTLQARVESARNYMIREARVAHGNTIALEYEPYYGRVDTNVIRSQTDEIHLLQGAGTGIFIKTVNQEVAAQSRSEQAPPRQAR